MSKSRNESTTWTLKVDKTLDKAIIGAVKQLGYTSKAELTREALREFLIRRKLYSLLDGEISIPNQSKVSPSEALSKLIELFKDIPKEVIREEVKKARQDVEDELLN